MNRLSSKSSFVKKELYISVEDLELVRKASLGMTNDEISKVYDISKRTIEGRFSNLMSITKTKNKTHLLAFLIKKGYLKL
jgi:DNA-binding CsgD family transcriptional regulator